MKKKSKTWLWLALAAGGGYAAYRFVVAPLVRSMNLPAQVKANPSQYRITANSIVGVAPGSGAWWVPDGLGWAPRFTGAMISSSNTPSPEEDEARRLYMELEAYGPLKDTKVYNSVMPRAKQFIAQGDFKTALKFLRDLSAYMG